MSVVAFERKPVTGVWSESELSTIVAALNAALAPATGREWETGMTENGDAQFYLLGPLPEQACELCLSRIGRRYVLEDGSAGCCSSIETSISWRCTPGPRSHPRRGLWFG